MYTIRVETKYGLMKFLDESEGVRNEGFYAGEVVNGVLTYGDVSWEVAAPIVVQYFKSAESNRIKLYKTIAGAKAIALKLYNKISEPEFMIVDEGRMCKYSVTVIDLETGRIEFGLYSNVL